MVLSLYSGLSGTGRTGLLGFLSAFYSAAHPLQLTFSHLYVYIHIFRVLRTKQILYIATQEVDASSELNY